MDYEGNVSTRELRLYFDQGLFHTEPDTLLSSRKTLINVYFHARFKFTFLVWFKSHRCGRYECLPVVLRFT